MIGRMIYCCTVYEGKPCFLYPGTFKLQVAICSDLQSGLYIVLIAIIVAVFFTSAESGGGKRRPGEWR